MTAIVHGWCRYVEKANEVVFQQMVLNKLWIPDVLIIYQCRCDIAQILQDRVKSEHNKFGL